MAELDGRQGAAHEDHDYARAATWFAKAANKGISEDKVLPVLIMKPKEAGLVSLVVIP